VSDVCLKARGCLRFGAVGGSDATGDDQIGIQVTRDVALVPRHRGFDRLGS
jgi:hypothetical protein